MKTSKEIEKFGAWIKVGNVAITVLSLILGNEIFFSSKRDIQ